MNDKAPARLHKKEPITLNYNKPTVYLIGALFILILLVIAFNIGSENINYLLWSCI